MSQSTDQSRTCTDAPQVTPPLRPIDFNGHTPADYDDAAVDRALGAWGDRYDSHAADRAFGDGPDGGAA